MKIYDFLSPPRTNPFRKKKCNVLVNQAIRRGELTKQPCVRCGNTKCLKAHHYDYSKPLDIIWLCVNCHAEVHMEIKRNDFLEMVLEYSFYMYHLKRKKQKHIYVLQDMIRKL